MKANIICLNQVDYSTVLGERILPFIVSLNLEKSVLYPAEGEYQRFCYDITGVGEDTSRYADLSHFLLGICSNITREDIAEITVSINEDPQTIVWGENVEIKTEEHPDDPTGCIGLKLDFPLNKQVGFMEVCISLRKVYPIGPVNVCLYGGETTAAGLEICGPACGTEDSCEAVFYQEETVCVPVKVTPYAKAGRASARCCGEPIVRTGASCQESQTSCSFTITQRLCVEIPIAFGADIETGTALIQCGEISENVCDCSGETPQAEPSQKKKEAKFKNIRRFS